MGREGRGRRFTVRYGREDIVLLAATDAIREDLAGPSLRRIQHREFEVFGKQEYQRLAGISMSHLYNLRNSTVYRNQRVRVNHTRSRQIDIGERRKPDPKGKPGCLRVDTVHQGHKGWQSGGLLHQFCRHRDAMAEPGMRGNHQRKAHASGAGSDPASVSVSDYRLPLRQWQRVSEPSRRQADEQTADRVHQVARLSYDRQRAGGRQERSRRAQAHRLRIHRCRTCRRTPAVLHGAVQSLSELSPAVWFCGAGKRSAWSDQAPLSSRRLSHSVREALLAGQLAAASQAGNHRISSAIASHATQRYRSSQRNAKSQARHSQARPDSLLTSRIKSEAPVSTALTGEGGSSAAPSPLDPSLASPIHSIRRNYSSTSQCFTSGSSRIGIDLSLQAHSALELSFTFRLISGLGNAVARDQYPPTPIPWGENPKVHFNSRSTPITCFRGLLKALSSATRALL